MRVCTSVPKVDRAAPASASVAAEAPDVIDVMLVLSAS
jgi:hypothetical protein